MEVSDLLDSLKRYPIAWISGIISLGLGIFLYFTNGSVTEYENQLFDLEREVDVLKSNNRQGADIEEDFQRLTEMFGSIESVLMDHTQIANNNGFFYSFTSEHPVEISNVSQLSYLEESPNPPLGDIWSTKHFSVIPFSLQAKGLLTELADMFYQFDVAPQLINIRRFDLRTTSVPEEGYMVMSLELNVLGKPSKSQ